MKRFIVASLIGIGAVPSFATTLVDIKLDQQINIGLGDAIYSQSGDATLSFVDDGTDKFARSSLKGGSWYYSPRIDLVKAGIGAISIADPLTVLSIDLRYFQGGDNTNPYGDAPVFLRLYTYEGTVLRGYRDFGIIYGPNMKTDPDKYPNWKTVQVFLNDSTKNTYTDTNSSGSGFDIGAVNQIRFYGTDWAGKGQDFMDAKNLKVETVPEPATMAVLGLGVLALIKRRRK